MSLGAKGWLERLLREAAAGHRFEPGTAAAQAAMGLPRGPGRARRYLAVALRETGLLYGTPEVKQEAGAGAEEQLFLAVVRLLARLGLDVAELVEARPGPRAEQLLVLFAVLGGDVALAEQVHRKVEKTGAATARQWQQVEAALEQRAGSLAGDPYYGLVLHNGAVYADAHLFGRAATAYWTTAGFPREAMERRLWFAAQQKARLVEVLVGLVTAERRPGFPARRAILRQIDDLGLPGPLADSTRDFARRAFERPVALKRLTAGIMSRDAKRFLVEQTVLASLVDGRRSPREVEWTYALGEHLGFTRAQLSVIELEMAEFYRRHRGVVDVFRLSGGAEVLGEEWVDTMSAAVRKNYRALLQEVKETGELSRLLAKAARGQALTASEKRAMRSQLIDVAKAVPALAIFAAPGGILLLLALAKVLPFDLLPSAFREEGPGDDAEAADPPARALSVRPRRPAASARKTR
jgi:DnaJ-domain-containing protein 1